MRRPLTRRHRLVVACVIAAAAVSTAPPASAAFPVLGPGYFQRDWLTTPAAGELSLGADSVQPDGSLLLVVRTAGAVSELRRYRPTDTTVAQGQLVMRDSDSTSSLQDVARVRGHLLVSEAYDPDHDYGRLLQVDPHSPAPRELLRWQDPFDIVTDPITGGLVLFDCPPGVDCFTTKGSTGVTQNDDERRIVAIDPATHHLTTLVPQTGKDVVGQFGVAISDDGQSIFASHKVSGIDVYARHSGALSGRIPTAALVDWMSYGPSHGCFAGQLVYQLDDGSIWSVRPDAALPVSRLVASSAQGLALVAGMINFDLQGRLLAVAARNFGSGSLTRIDCRPVPAPEGAPAAQGPTRQSHAHPAKAGRQPPAGHPQPPVSGHSPGGAPGPAAPPGSAQTAPGTQPVTQPAQAPTFGHAAQGAAGAQPGLADAAEDTPQLGFSASRRRPHEPAPAAVWFAAALLATAGTAAHRSLDRATHRRSDLHAPFRKAHP